MKDLTSALRKWQVALVLSVGTLSLASASTATLTVQVDQPSRFQVSKTLYGIFFEDINCSADGGLYAELVRNRNFEDAGKPDHWSVLAKDSGAVEMSIDTSKPASERNRQSLQVKVSDVRSGPAGIFNEGFWGMSVIKGQFYDLTLLARAEPRFKGPLLISLESVDGTVYASEKVSGLGAEWKDCRVPLKSKGTDPRARLVIRSARTGVFWLDMVSLFPRNTWKGRPQYLRKDLATALEWMAPAFVRFPGGCWVEGDRMKDAYRWKQTIGKLSERRTQYNIWQYHATHGLGYHEYLQMCEDLGAEPLFVINCGMSHREVVPMNEVGEYVQDALDAIEYANGPVTSKWGAIRAKNGHPAAFDLKYMEIGNENGGPAYNERYALFYEKIKASYPNITLIANEWGGRPGDSPIEIIDEHYYSTPEFFMANAGKYDNYDRTGRKVYVGEYAVTQNGGQGNLRAAVGEAAFMTGMERNSDVVVMSSYAPLFANVNYKKWNPDLINFDSSRVYGIPSYYVQKMFSRNRSERILPLEIQAPEVQSSPKSGGIGVGTWVTQAEYKDIKVERDGKVLFAADPAKGTNGWRLRGGKWSASEGVIRQEALGENIRAFAGDKSWKNYSYSLKARKIGGSEGFLIPFLVQNEDTKSWWNLGGWNNTRHALEMQGLSAEGVPGKIETGRWYDIRIELSEKRVKCYLDGALIHDVEYPRMNSLYGVAGITGEDVILKVVNVGAEQLDAEVRLSGAKAGYRGLVTVLTSTKPEDENTLDHPTKVSPLDRGISFTGTKFLHAFPGNSVTVFRLRPAVR